MGFPEIYPRLVDSKNKEVRAARQGGQSGVSSSKVRNRRLKSTFSKSQIGPEADHRSLANLLIIMLFSFTPVTLVLGTESQIQRSSSNLGNRWSSRSLNALALTTPVSIHWPHILCQTQWYMLYKLKCPLLFSITQWGVLLLQLSQSRAVAPDLLASDWGPTTVQLCNSR